MLIRAASSEDGFFFILGGGATEASLKIPPMPQKNLRGHERTARFSLFLIRFYLSDFLRSFFGVPLMGYNLRGNNGGGWITWVDAYSCVCERQLWLIHNKGGFHSPPCSQSLLRASSNSLAGRSSLIIFRNPSSVLNLCPFFNTPSPVNRWRLFWRKEQEEGGRNRSEDQPLPASSAHYSLICTFNWNICNIKRPRN